jgi:prepilin signal peptidase PulO-like enzyme (type II secretory pathway)
MGWIGLGAAVAWLVTLTVYDVRQRRLPNALTLPGALAVLVVAALAGRGTSALLGGVLLAALYLGWAGTALFLQKHFHYVHVPETLLMMAVFASNRWAVVPLVIGWQVIKAIRK